MSAHTLNSPSSFFRRRLCPGSKRMEEGTPNTDNPHSLRGTAAHTVGEICLKENKTPGYFEGIPVSVEKVDGTLEDIIITKEDTAALWTYVDYVQRRLDEFGKTAAEGFNPVVTLEEEVDPGIWLGRNDVAGSLDCSIFNGSALETIDYKHGSGKAVEAASQVNGVLQVNDQGILYVIGKLATLDWTSIPTDIPVTFTIVQPRCPHPQGPIRSVTMPATEWFALVNEYKALAAATDDPEAPLIPGDEQCFFCKAKATCPALNKRAMEVFQPVVDNVPDTGIYTSPPYETPRQAPSKAEALPKGATGWDAIEDVLGRPTDQLNLEHKIRALEAEKLVMAWFKAIREDLTGAALEGQEVPGYKLVASTTQRRWEVNDDLIIKRLAALRTTKGKTIGKAGATTVKPLSPAQAEKQLRPVVSEQSWRAIDKLIIKPEGAPTLVPLTDKREPLKRAEEVFEKVETAEVPSPPWM